MQRFGLSRVLASTTSIAALQQQSRTYIAKDRSEERNYSDFALKDLERTHETATRSQSDFQREFMRNPMSATNVAHTSNSASLTGSAFNPVFDDDSMYGQAAYSNIQANLHSNFVSDTKYHIDTVKETQGAKVSALLSELSSAQTDVIWQHLFKLVPNLASPLTADVQSQILDFYARMALVAHDASELEANASSFVLENFQERFVTQAHWWRIEESIVHGLRQLPKSTTYDQSIVDKTLEAVTKAIINSLAAQPWATKDFTGAHQVELNSNSRIVHDAGLW